MALADSGKRYVSLRVETRRVLPLVSNGEQYYGFLLLFRFRTGEVTDMFDREFFDDLDVLDGARRLCKDHTVEVHGSAETLRRRSNQIRAARFR